MRQKAAGRHVNNWCLELERWHIVQIDGVTSRCHGGGVGLELFYHTSNDFLCTGAPPHSAGALLSFVPLPSDSLTPSLKDIVYHEYAVLKF